MGSKRSSHLDDPPTASSSEEEEEEEEETLSEEEETSSEEEEAAPKISSLPSTPVTDKKPQPKNPDPAPISKHRLSFSGSGSDSESETDSESPPDPNVKPIASKPMEDLASSKTTKRPNTETDETTSSPKRAKKDGSEPNAADGVVSPEDSKKKLFQRLWSEDDEIAILQGLLEFVRTECATAFHEQLQEAVHKDVTKYQVMDKIRRLKKKYYNNAARGKKGKDPNFSKTHDRKVYEISKMIWASKGAGLQSSVDAKSGGKARGAGQQSFGTSMYDWKVRNSYYSYNYKYTNNILKGNDSIRSLREELLAKKNLGKMEMDGILGSSRCFNEMVRFDKNMGVVGLEESVVKRGLDLIGERKRKELEERWKEVNMAELEVFVKRSELISNQARLIFEAYKAAK